MSVPNAAIFFEPDGYVLDGPKLMGRQSAGNAFLRAAVKGLKGHPCYAYTANRKSADAFEAIVKNMDPQASPKWIPSDRLDLLAEVGALYVPDPSLSTAGRLRLRQGPTAYSIIGVTHTTASHGAMDLIVDMVTDPVMPWDALICTSRAVAVTVNTLLEEQANYLRGRFGADLKLTSPQLPVIPLGVHCADFDFSEEQKAKARRDLKIKEDEIVFLFVGRLSFHAKAHPHVMYKALQKVAEETGKSVTLMQCGWFNGEHVERAFKEGAEKFCPGVRTLYVSGKEAESRQKAWGAADIFISMSDNIQETFGLTPIEAMAAGLPSLVTDWDGYKDTIRDGEDGFRIPTRMPGPGYGDFLARGHESGMDTYDYFCGLTCQTVSVDFESLVRAMKELAENPDLRRRMGRSGRARAREFFDWDVIFRVYQGLWAQLGEIRMKSKVIGAPAAMPARMDPFRAFSHYATALNGPEAIVSVVEGATRAVFEEMAKMPLFSYASKIFPSAADVESILNFLRDGPLSIQVFSDKSGIPMSRAVILFSILAKMGLVRLSS